MNKLFKISAAGLLLAAVSQAQIEINENLSFTGFFDMSVVHTDSDSGGDDTSYNFDQAELDFIFSFEELTGQVDLNYLGDNDTGDFSLEQAFITYDLGEGSSVTAGKFLSFHGWETAEPTGLFQYSYAYDLVGTIPGYFNGVSYGYNTDAMSLGFSLVDSIYGADGSLSDSEYGIEAKAAFFPVEGATIYLGYAVDNMDTGEDMTLVNLWASYEVGNATYAVEVNDYDFGGDAEGNQWLVMANYGITDSLGITFRVSEDEDGTINESATKYTISPGWSVGENLLMLMEVSNTDFGSEGDDLAIAFETLFTF